MIYSHTLPFMSEKLLLFFICIASHVAFGCCNSYTYDAMFSVIWSRKKLVKCIDSTVTLNDLTRKVWGGVVLYAIFKDFPRLYEYKLQFETAELNYLSENFIESYVAFSCFNSYFELSNKRAGKIWWCLSTKCPQVSGFFFLKRISEHARLLQS